MDKMTSRTEVVLKHLALIKVATSLWSINYIPKSLEDNRWFEAEKLVLNNAEKLSLPKLLIEEIKIFIKIVGVEIYRFIIDLFDVDEIGIKTARCLVSYLCWTEQAKVNLRKTLTIASKDENINIFVRYRLCCRYCVDHCIAELWKHLTESDKVKLTTIAPDHDDLSLENIWSLNITNQIHQIDDIESRITYLTVSQANQAAFEYYFNRLDANNKKDHLMASFLIVGEQLTDNYKTYNFLKLYSDIQACWNELLVYLFSQADYEIISRIPQTNLKMRRILICYLNWPHHQQFLTIIESLKSLLQKEDYLYIIQSILSKIKCNWKDCDYSVFLLTCWKKCAELNNEPLPLIIAESFIGFIHNLDTESASLILRCITPRLRKEMIFTNKGYKLCKFFGIMNNWNLLKLFIINCVPKESFPDFKQMFNSNEEHLNDQLIYSNICSFEYNTLNTFNFYLV